MTKNSNARIQILQIKILFQSEVLDSQVQQNAADNKTCTFTYLLLWLYSINNIVLFEFNILAK